MLHASNCLSSHLTCSQTPGGRKPRKETKENRPRHGMPLEGSKAIQSISTDLDFVGDNQGTVPSRARIRCWRQSQNAEAQRGDKQSSSCETPCLWGSSRMKVNRMEFSSLAENQVSLRGTGPHCSAQCCSGLPNTFLLPCLLSTPLSAAPEEGASYLSVARCVGL